MKGFSTLKMNGMTLGQKVKEARLAKKLTQREVTEDFITRNMLSQIENDQAVPSIKTMEYLAKKLDKPISYFIDNNQGNDINGNTILLKIMRAYNDEDYKYCIRTIENIYNKTKLQDNIMNTIFLNSLMKIAIDNNNNNLYIDAKKYYSKIIEYKDVLKVDSYLLNEVYANLAYINIKLEKFDEAISNNNKSLIISKKQYYRRKINEVYIYYLNNKYDLALEEARDINVDSIDECFLVKYYYVLGSIYMEKKQFKEATKNLELAISILQKKEYLPIRPIYKKLGECFSELDDYKKAYKYMIKAHD